MKKKIGKDIRDYMKPDSILDDQSKFHCCQVQPMGKDCQDKFWAY